MNITSSNLKENFELIVQSIRDADYIAFDTEFTGLSDGLIRIHQFESLEDRYQKIKINIEKFWICQLGIATFKLSEEASGYTSQVFNFYMIPENRELHVSFDSMNFLVRNGFDMNLLFKEAICCKKPGFDNWNEKPSRYGVYRMSSEKQALMDNYEKAVVDFMRSDAKSFSLEMPDEYTKKLFFGSHGVAALFKHLEIKADKANPLLILFKKAGKKVAEYRPREDELEEEKEPCLMFDIIQVLLGKKGPLIGHYMILDLAFLYDHFIAPLPNTLEEFRKALLSTFPPIFDTKYIVKSLFSNVKFIKHTSVEDLYGYCKKRKELNNLVKIAIDEKFALSSQSHEAGFDAYMTGYIYINLSKFLPNPTDMDSAAGKICLQGHYKEFINIVEENQEDFNFNGVIKIKTLAGITIKELSIKLGALWDNFIIQENENTFFAELFQVIEMEQAVNELNQIAGLKVVRFIDRNLI